jgi:hypothetical protein
MTAIRDPFRIKDRRQFFECLLINTTLKIHDLVERLPISDPAPGIEFGLVGAIETEGVLTAIDPQHEPDLFLADADRTRSAAMAPDIALWQVITQPAARASQDGDLLCAEPDLLF